MVLFTAWAVWLDAQVRQRFDGNKWTLPAKVYARPLTLYPNKLLSAEQLQAELAWSDYHPSNNPTHPGTYQQYGANFTIYRRATRFWDEAEPARLLQLKISNGRIVSLTENGRQLSLARLEPQYIGGIFPAQNEDRELVHLNDVPKELLAALIVTEDIHFMQHFGISLRGVARALLVNLRAGGVVQGGSTLTQQLVKNFFLTQERSLVRKAQEAMMALLVELHYDKKEIMQAYLNEVYLGQAGRRAIHGFGLASRFYFAKPINELNHAEIATLVGLVKGASYYNPRRHPERAKNRRDLVLGLMADNNIISKAERIRAQGQPLIVAAADRAGQREYPAFLELAKQQLRQDYRLQDLQNEGLRIFTTLDPWAQNALEQSAQQQLKQLEQRFPAHKNQLQTAAVITSVDGGEVRALLGGREPEFFGFNRALNARRAIGSIAKPVVYLAALESGQYHWGSLLNDDSFSVQGENGQLWQPQNYDKKSHGQVAMVDALSQSYNQATARLGMQTGLEKVVNTFKRLGVKEVPPYPSITLGALSLSPLDVASMYQGIVSQGFVMPLRTIEAVTDNNGQVLSSYGIQGEQRFDPATIQWLTWGLEQVAVTGTAKALSWQLPKPVAAKTGTSNDQRDAWFAGFDNRHLGIIWVGRDDNQAMPFAGGTAALPIWSNAFKQIGVEPLPELALTWANVDQQGEIVGKNCQGESYPFPAQRIPSNLIDCKQNKTGKSWFDWLF